MISDDERRALSALRFNWAPTGDDVWSPLPFHVPGLHRDVLEMVLQSYAEAEGQESSPVGVALLGERGTGKTHLLAAVREQVHAREGYFFLIELTDSSAFWNSVALSVVQGLTREPATGESQLVMFLRKLADACEAPRGVRRAVTGKSELTRAHLDAFVDQVRKRHRQVGTEAQDTVRALVLRAADSANAVDIGHEFLLSNDEVEPGERSRWGMRRGRRSAQEVVRDISHLLALTGPTIMAVDQIDMLVSESSKAVASDNRPEWGSTLLLEHIAGGLMALRQTTRRTLSVVSCLPWVWDTIRTTATNTVQDRFREAVHLKLIPTAEIGRELVASRFSAKFADAGFTPPHPTWPVAADAFAEVVQFTPRELLRTIDTHIRGCLQAGEATELTHLLHKLREETPEQLGSAALSEGELAAFDARHAELLASAGDPTEALNAATEDMLMPRLLRAGLTAWIGAREEPDGTFGIDPDPGSKPALHARLRQVLDEHTEAEIRWSFRAVHARHHISVLNRIKNAQTAAGLAVGRQDRRLVLLRNIPFSGGVRTNEVLAKLRAAGGSTLELPGEDVVRLTALRSMIEEFGTEGLRPWFRARQPADAISILRDTLPAASPEAPPPAAWQEAAPPPAAWQEAAPPPAARQEAAPPPEATPATTVGSSVETGGRIVVGAADGDGKPVGVDLVALRKHTAIFAGSGSGKTVLIRRLVEECALQGVSSIVLDPNNDLSRLGDPWPEPPTGWDPADGERAARYFRTAEVVVWTPRLESGRPLSFQPLPDFSEMVDDPDALQAGIDSAVAALAPRAGAEGVREKARLGQAVLREALLHFARAGSHGLAGFVALLGDLPEEVSRLDDAPKLAAQMARLLTATMVNDPLFGGSGTPTDPGILLTPAPGYAARVSVINFSGLTDDAQRQSFVNQLQLALFAWVKRHPAADRPLGGLLVMDEAQTFAPSGAMTACTHSTLALASQARKYGLGLVFATQAPKGLHNRIPGNAATQFFGLLNHPTQIASARKLARAKGSDVADIARLRAGQFYAAVEGGEFVRMRAPWSLSHHPQSPPTTEEVLERARRGPGVMRIP